MSNFRGAEGWVDRVRAFHVKYGHPVAGRPGLVTDRVALARARMMTEELAETIEAMHEYNLPEIADGLADLAYVVIGTALVYGVPLEAMFHEVHVANMTKRPLNQHGKGGKGEGYVKADPTRVLREHGWEES